MFIIGSIANFNKPIKYCNYSNKLLKILSPSTLRVKYGIDYKPNSKNNILF